MTDLPCPICQSDNLGRGHTRHRKQKGGAMVPAVQCFECGCVAPAEAWNSRSNHLHGLPQEAPQPIDTAPKDGSHILAWRVPLGIRVTDNTHPPTVVHWFDDPDEPGFYTSVNELAPEHPFNPTHWMPLPPRPSLSRPHQPPAQEK